MDPFKLTEVFFQTFFGFTFVLFAFVRLFCFGVWVSLRLLSDSRQSTRVCGAETPLERHSSFFPSTATERRLLFLNRTSFTLGSLKGKIPIDRVGFLFYNII